MKENFNLYDFIQYTLKESLAYADNKQFAIRNILYFLFKEIGKNKTNICLNELINKKDFSIENVKNSFKENKVTKCENIDQIIFNSLSLDSFIIEVFEFISIADKSRNIKDLYEDFIEN